MINAEHILLQKKSVNKSASLIVFIVKGVNIFIQISDIIVYETMYKHLVIFRILKI